MNALNQNELERYSRQLALPGFGVKEQLSLITAKVLVVGCGGLGNPVLMYLTAAGIGTIGLADDDLVQLDNLQRQVLFTEKEIGKFKVETAIQRLQPLQPLTKFVAHHEKLHSQNAKSIITPYDIVVDCTDNFEVRYVLDDACSFLRKPLIYGALYKFEGQVSVFHHQTKTRYRDICPEPPPEGRIPDCETGGVLGTLAGTIGCIQANEVIKLITGIGDSLDGKLLMVNLHDNTMHKIQIQKREILETTSLDNSESTNTHLIREIKVEELKKMLDSKEDFQLIDVREPDEFEQFNLGGELMPMNSIDAHLSDISKSKKVIVHCKAGLRSAYVIQYLQKQYGFQNLYNLKGGTQAWLKHN